MNWNYENTTKSVSSELAFQRRRYPRGLTPSKDLQWQRPSQFSRLEDRTTIDWHDFTDVFYVLDLYHSWNSAHGGLISESTTSSHQQHLVAVCHITSCGRITPMFPKKSFKNMLLIVCFVSRNILRQRQRMWEAAPAPLQVLVVT